MHTPGPWRVGGASGNGGEARVIVSDSRCIAWTACSHDEDHGDVVTAEDDANACLIAAAPALLDRLRSMVSGAECECDTADDEHPLCDICWSRQVIAQATGKEVPNG